MQLDLYEAETARIAAEQSALLHSARDILRSGRALSPLEQSGVLHALQILVENAIGKAKQWLKAKGKPVPISGYDAFKALGNMGIIPQEQIPQWNAVIGLRNRIVHDYMNIDFEQVVVLVRSRQEEIILDFLMRPIAVGPNDSAVDE